MAKGLVRILESMIASLSQKTELTQEDHKEIVRFRYEKDNLIMNGSGPMPQKFKNQRQKRKAWRRTPQTRRK
jgi:hypothetical protein